MGKIGDLWVRLGLKKDEFTAGLDSAEKESQSFSQRVGNAFNGLATKVAALTVAFAAIGRGIGEAVRNIAQFERANSELAAVLGTTLKGVEGLSKSAKDLGRTSEFTASEVTQLQIALARLGFDTGQIESMQSSVLKFALAMGTDLGSAAEFTGAALRAFGLEANDTQYLLDVMSKSTTLSALNFSKLQTSISTVAPIAKSFGLNIQETSAFLGILANNGFDASSAATALRNILLNLADSNGKLAQGIGHTARTFPEIIAAFKELRDKGVDVSAVLDMTDKRSAAAAIALIESAEAADELKRSLDGADGSLNTMSDTMSDNVIGSVKALQSAWEGLTLAFEGSKGPIKWVVDRMTDILNRLTDIITQTEKISGWEMILGPVVGGAIAGGKKRKQAEQTEDYTVPGGSGGGGRPSPTPKPTYKPTVTPEEIEKQRKAQEKAERERLAALREEAAAIAEVREADEAYAQESIDSYNALRERNGWTDRSPFSNDELMMYASALKDVIDYENELADITNMLASNQDNLNQKLSESLEGTEAFRQKAEELGKAISEQLVSALKDGLVGAFNALADVLAGVTDGSFENVTKALIEPLADMAIKAGTLIMMSGTAIEALKDSLIGFFGGNAVLAGAALVAVGVAAKAGLAAIGNRGASGSTVSSYSSSGIGYGAGGVQSAELVVRVEGTVKGSDIILSGQNTLDSWNR